VVVQLLPFVIIDPFNFFFPASVMANLTYQEMVAMLSGVDVDAVYKDIKKWQDAELKGDMAKIKALDFSVAPVVSLQGLPPTTLPFSDDIKKCFRCSSPCMDPVTKQYKVCMRSDIRPSIRSCR
jgi:hypothetical protein